MYMLMDLKMGTVTAGSLQEMIIILNLLSSMKITYIALLPLSPGLTKQIVTIKPEDLIIEVMKATAPFN